MSALAGREEELCYLFNLETDDVYGEHKKTGMSNKFAPQDFEELVILMTKGRYYTQLKYYLSKNDAKFHQELKRAESKQIKMTGNHISSYYRTDKSKSVPPNKDVFNQSLAAQKPFCGPKYLPMIHRNTQVTPETPINHKSMYNSSNEVYSISKPSRDRSFKNKPIHYSYLEKLQKETPETSYIRPLSRESIDASLSDSFSDSGQNKSDFLLSRRPRHPKSNKHVFAERRKKFKLDIKPQSEFSRLFRELGSISEKTFLANSQLSVEALRGHLLKKYPEEIVERVMECLDFTSSIEFGTYVQSIETLMNKDIEELYFLAHRIYDFNNDGKICSQDLFKLFRLSKIYPSLESDFSKFFLVKTVCLKNLTEYRGISPKPPSKEKESIKVDYKKRYYELNHKQPSYAQEIENNLLKEENSNYTVSTENEFLRKAFKAKRAAKKNITTISNFHKYLADLRLQKRVPTNKVTENYKSLFHFISSTPNPKPNIPVQRQIKQSTGTSTGAGFVVNNESNLATLADTSNKNPEKISLHETWSSLEVDIFGMLDIFPSDVPDIIYNILNYLALVSFSKKMSETLPQL